MKIFMMIALTTFSAASFACSCAEWGNGKDLVRDASAAFVGYPSSDSVASGTQDEWRVETKTFFTVLKSFKPGRSEKNIEIYGDKSDGANCGVDFKKNTGLFLIFAYKENGKLQTSSCALSYAHSPESLRVMADILR